MRNRTYRRKPVCYLPWLNKPQQDQWQAPEDNSISVPAGHTHVPGQSHLLRENQFLLFPIIFLFISDIFLHNSLLNLSISIDWHGYSGAFPITIIKPRQDFYKFHISVLVFQSRRQPVFRAIPIFVFAGLHSRALR